MITRRLYRLMLFTNIFITFFCFKGFSQKGMPAKETTSAEVNTNFPQHEDFKASMVNRLIVPQGFKVAIAATGLGKPRMIARGDDGSIYITRRDVGDVLLLRDKDRDGRFEDLKTVHTMFAGVHGITIHNGFMYLCSNRILKRAKIKQDGTLEISDTLIKDLPDGGQHGNRTIAFGPDNMLYISVGSTCNDCGETNAESATLLQVTPDGTKRRIFARGLRNTIGFDWEPKTNLIWGVDNGTDWRGDDIPPEELNQIKDSAHYGWPLVFADRKIDQTREDPPGTTKEDFAKTTEPSALTFPAHSAPINFLFLDKVNGIPADWKDDALVSWHGSWNKVNPDGYKVQRIKFEGGKPTGAEDFLTGFFNKSTRTRFGRPTGLAISPAGVIYITDDANGVLYSITKTN